MKDSSLNISVYKNDFYYQEIIFAWEIVNQNANAVAQTVFPALCIDIIFPVYGYLIVDGDKVTEPFVSPILTLPKGILIGEETRLAGIRFSAIHFKNLLSIHPDKLKQTYNTLKSFISHDLFNRILTNLTNSLETEELLKNLIDVLVTDSDNRQNGKSFMLNQAINAIKNEPEIRISDLSELLGLSLRSLEMVFKEYLGTSPSIVKKVLQFNKAISLIHSNTENKLTDIALISGYFDQSHFIRSFKQLSGLLPSQFAKENQHFYKVMNS